MPKVCKDTFLTRFEYNFFPTGTTLLKKVKKDGYIRD
jgi:hypothetical protein